jgi:hypothetical protein
MNFFFTNLPDRLWGPGILASYSEGIGNCVLGIKELRCEADHSIHLQRLLKRSELILPFALMNEFLACTPTTIKLVLPAVAAAVVVIAVVM